MSNKKTDQTKQGAEEFSAQANEAQQSLPAEFLEFLMTNKRWWLTPIILALLMLGLVIILGGTAAGPFIYTLF